MLIRDRIVDFRRVKAAELRPSPKNWRKHPQAQQDALRGLLAEVGYVDALMVRPLPDGTLEIVDGHLRADTTPEMEVPCLVVDLDDAEAAKVLSTFDPLAALAEADSAKLDALLREVETGSEALSKMLADLANEAGLYQTPAVHEDDVPEPPKVPVTRPGDLWILGEHRLLCGDSTKAEDVARVMGGEKADCLCWDPPFNVGFEYEGEFSGCDNKTPGEYGDWLNHCLVNFESVSHERRTCFVWQGMRNIKHFGEWFSKYDWRLISVAKGFVQSRPTWLQWATDPVIAWTTDNTPRPVTSRDFFYNGQSANTSKTDDRIISGKHPCPRSVEVCAYFLSGWIDEGCVVCDLSVGSGTTIIAAEQLSRRCRAIEISPAYCDVAVERWQNLTGQKAKRG